jgi:hypothetical protein
MIPLAVPVPGEGLATVKAPSFQAQAPTRVDFLAADTDVIVAHPLGRPPLGVLVVGLAPTASSGHTVVYFDPRTATERDVTLRASATGIAWVLFL